MNCNRRHSGGVWARVALLIALVAALASQRSEMTKPFPPQKVIGNVYFVGMANLGSYRVMTPEGHILVNTDFEEAMRTIRATVERLGFNLGGNLRGNVDA